MKNQPDFANHRKYIRFEPDPLDYALIDFKLNFGEFRPEIIALIVDEAPLGGCGLVIKKIDDLKIQQACVIKVGRMAPIAAEVAWFKKLEDDLMRIGIKYLE